MNAGSVFAILILTTEVAYTCRCAKGQAHITLNIRCSCLRPSMTIMTLVHSMHHMEWTRRVNRRQLEEDIPIKGGRKELHPLDFQTIEIKSLKTFLTPFEARSLFKESTTLRDVK
jgi:hypothetical protein